MSEKINFTKDVLLKLEPRQDGKRLEVWDTKVDGLLMQITKTGTKTFYLRKHEKVCLGKFPDVSIENARKLAKQLIGEFAADRNPIAENRKQSNEPTLLELFNKYMNHHGSKVTRPDKLRDLYRIYLSHWGDRKISKIPFTEVDDWHKALPKQIRERSNKDVSGERTANMALALLHSIYGKARQKRWYAGENPAYGIEKFKEVSRERFLQAEEIPGFFEAVMEEPNRTLRDYFIVLLLTGARRTKVLSMRWHDISFERAEWKIPRERNEKNVAVVPLVSEVIELLEYRKKSSESEYVFPGTGKKGHLAEPRKGWERVLERAGLKDLRIHDLRRTLGSWQAKTGSSLVIIGKSLGHTSQQATQIYSRLDIDPVRESVQRATDAMISLTKVKKE